LPPLLNNTIMTIKVTAYSSVVGVWELTYAAREVVERTLAAFEIFIESWSSTSSCAFHSQS
jgi:polar amino acid transport system permease protein